MTKYLFILIFPLVTFAQTSNQISIIAKAPATNIFLASQQDSKGNEYVVFVDFDKIDSTISIKLHKYDNIDNTIFDIKLKTFPYNSSNPTYNLCNAGIQIDSLDNIYVFCSTPSLVQPDSSLHSDIDGYKIDKTGNKLWGSLGKNFTFQEKNIYWADAILEIHVLGDGSVHLFRLQDFSLNLFNGTLSSVVYYNIDRNGNKVFEKNIPNEKTDSAFYYFNDRSSVAYKVFKDESNNLNLFHFWNNTATEYKIHSYKFNANGLISEKYNSGLCDSLSNFDIVKFDDNIFLQKRQNDKTLYSKYLVNESFENNPTLSLDEDIYSIIKKGNYYYYSILDSNHLAKYIQKVDLMGNKLYGEKGFEIRESAYSLNKAKYSLSLILLPKEDGSLMVLNSGPDSLGYSIGFISISNLNTPIIYPEQKILKSCSPYLFEIPGNAYINSNTGLYNLYLEDGYSSELRRIKFNSITIDYCNDSVCKSIICVPISIKKTSKIE